MAKTSGLGRGFDSLLPSDVLLENITATGEKVQLLPLHEVTANPNQPRREFDEAMLQDLAASVAEYGVLQPIVVTRLADGGYQIVAGERRYRASKIADLPHIPALVRSHDELQKLEIGLVENIQRVDLGALEQAIAMARLRDEYGLTQADIAKRLGKAGSTVANMLRLLQLPEESTLALREGKMSEGHARAVLSLKGQLEQQLTLTRLIIANGWSVRQAEAWATTQLAPKIRPGETPKAQAAPVQPVVSRIQASWSAHVSYAPRAKGGGTLKFSFKDDAALKKLLDALDK
jgi:ParB family transcriptional regulator, chromosome partitioning protein